MVEQAEERSQFPVATDIIDIVVSNANSIVQHHALQHMTPTYALNKTFEELSVNKMITMTGSGNLRSREKLQTPVSPMAQQPDNMNLDRLTKLFHKTETSMYSSSASPKEPRKKKQNHHNKSTMEKPSFVRGKKSYHAI